MRNHNNLKQLLVTSIFGALIVVGTVLTVGAQDRTEEYREWQRAQRRAEQERQDYMRSRSPRDYRQWQNAQRRAQQEYAEYQRVNSGYGYNTGYNNNSRLQFRVYTNGSYYSTDSRGAELLRRAVRNGYSQGFRQGQMDRRNGRGYDYYDESLYRNGTYGYQSYAARNQYQHYFQQGFQRGYEDGYRNSYRYGTRSGSTASILSGVLNTILNISRN